MDDLEERFITEYHYKGSESETQKDAQVKVASHSTLEEKEAVDISVPLETNLIEEKEVEETLHCNNDEAIEGNNFQSYNIPLFDKNAWDDTALIEAWDMAINQRDNPSTTVGKDDSSSSNHQLNYKKNKPSKENLNSGRNPTTKVPKLLNNKRESVLSHKKLRRSRRKPSRNHLDKHSTQNSFQVSNNTHGFSPVVNNVNSNSQAIYSAQQIPQSENIINAAPISIQPLVPPASMLPFAQGQRDEDLDNLLMSWYFTGYYTALYQKSRK